MKVELNITADQYIMYKHQLRYSNEDDGWVPIWPYDKYMLLKIVRQYEKQERKKKLERILEIK